MNMSMITQMNARRWNGLVLGIIVAVMVHLTAATDAGRFDDPGRCCCRASRRASIQTSRCCTSAPMDRLRSSCSRRARRSNRCKPSVNDKL